MPAVSEDRPPAVVFDIGGTWFRAGIWEPTGVRDLERRVSISREHCPHLTLEELQAELIEYLLDRARALVTRAPATRVGISLGAAIDANTGLVVGAAPLWGPTERLDWDIQRVLREAAPEYEWGVVNDVTAAAVALAHRPEHQDARRLAVLTIGSGVALRTIEPRTCTVPTNRRSGLQGEVGHLPATFTYRGVPVERRCACGAWNHLSAFCSGQAIEAQLGELKADGCAWLSGELPAPQQFATALAEGNREAGEFLTALTRPLAETLISALSIDAAIDRVAVIGGVVEGLTPWFTDSLLENLAVVGLYGGGRATASDFASIVGQQLDSAEIALAGAALSLPSSNAWPDVDAAESATQTSSKPRPASKSRSWRVRGMQELAYEIVVADDITRPDNPAFAALIGAGDRRQTQHLVVADATVWRLHGRSIRDYMVAHGSEPLVLTLVAGEATKGPDAVREVLDECVRRSLPRRDPPIVAIGGGVVLDIVGLAANLFRRGVPYVRVPTTLLAMIDAAIGVKTAVNYGRQKNAIGTYYAPESVLIDPGFLATLPRRELASGYAEAVKIALVADADLFELLESRSGQLLDPDPVSRRELIGASISAILPELERNLWERDLERAADFGHTFSPVIEMASEGRLLHGEAVALDIALCLELAEGRDHLDETDGDRARRLLANIELPSVDELMSDALIWQGLQATARHRGGRQRVPLPVGIGRVTFVNDITRPELAAALSRLRRQHVRALR